MAQLLSQLPIGAKVKEPNTKYYGSPLQWIVIGKDIDGNGNTTLLTEKIIALKCFDAAEYNPRTSGNNNYKVSNIRQWLNKSTSPWYEKQHTNDKEPNSANVQNGINPYNTEAGFLNGFSADFLAILQSVTKIVAKPSTDGGGSETITDKLFLLSKTEVGLGNENNIAEGTTYPVFTNNTNRQCKCTAEAITHSSYTSNPTVNDNWYWWLRTPYASTSTSVRRVQNNGDLLQMDAYYGTMGIRPACVIPSSTRVSDTTDSDGCYTIVYNQDPEISPVSKDYGECTSPIQDTFTITDPDGDAFTGQVLIDGNQFMTFNGISSTSISVDMIQIWANLTISAHTMTIIVTDSNSATTTEYYTFEKVASPVVLSGTDESLGRLYEVPTVTYSIEEVSWPVVWIKESIDGTVSKTILAPTVGADYTFDLSSWDDLALGNHTIVITAQDVNGGSGTRTYTFTKLYNHLEFYTEKDETDAAAEAIICNGTYTGASIQVEVCNNAFDVYPTWEDMTQEFLEKRPHEFTNDFKEADKWGIQFHITIIKSPTIKDVSCTSFAYAYR